MTTFADINFVLCQTKTFKCMIIKEKENQSVSNEVRPFNEVTNIESICAVLGLNFPESATEFQKAMLTIAHLSASLRDFVLKGVDVPRELLWTLDQLNEIVIHNELNQR